MILSNERATEGRENMEEVDPRILQVIENSVAASRWRIAARFEGRETARQYRRLADERSRAATRLCSEVAAATADLDVRAKVASDEADHPRNARDGAGGLLARRTQTEN